VAKQGWSLWLFGPQSEGLRRLFANKHADSMNIQPHQ
jgi:hypothetical protein